MNKISFKLSYLFFASTLTLGIGVILYLAYTNESYNVELNKIEFSSKCLNKELLKTETVSLRYSEVSNLPLLILRTKKRTTVFGPLNSLSFCFYEKDKETRLVVNRIEKKIEGKVVRINKSCSDYQLNLRKVRLNECF